jgi:Lanthionine synthetase C-like protein
MANLCKYIYFLTGRLYMGFSAEPFSQGLSLMERPDQLIGEQMARRDFLRFTRDAAIALGTASVLSACDAGEPSHNTAPSPSEGTTTPEQRVETFLLRTGDALINLHNEKFGGWRFASEIQGGNYQTDSDVGAASVGNGFLTLADKYVDDKRYLDAARLTGEWLIKVSRPDGKGGRYWPDYVDDNGVASEAYTSFDDGALGIGDFFWRLFEKTKDERYKQVAIETLNWTFSQAENIGQGEDVFRWRWDAHDNSSPYNMGMGEGAVGLVHTFATYYERLKDSDPDIAGRCKTYIDGTLNYIDNVKKALANELGDSRYARALPETGVIGQDGDAAMNSGFVSGAAGGAFTYLKLYQVFNDRQYLDKANELFDWLEDTDIGPMVDFGDGTIAWKVAIDPEDTSNTDNPHYATGFEEGAAGIGWVYLQAYKLTGQERYRSMAEKAANWLLKIALGDLRSGMSWFEYVHPDAPAKLIHPNLDNGTAGIGMFLRDLYLATKVRRFQAGALGCLRGVMTAATIEHGYPVWHDADKKDSGKIVPYSRDPSMHWGLAGYIMFIQRMLGGLTDAPGLHPGLS